ncbi:MAG: nucleotidyltransferase [Lachnospiraceae bacterium]|nr:nucleotidyltransferase [Lachnospiraceae bacterium]
MKKPVLVIMAAGLGSRYGGLKQIDSMDSEGHTIIDFSIYDAIQAGFEEIVFIIIRENEVDFRAMIGNRIERHVKVHYVFQQLKDLPGGYEVPEGRVRPWGTGHAVLSCIDILHDVSFAVINADDYYDKEAFCLIYNYLNSHYDDEKYRYAMVGYAIKNTVTENGPVARGICRIDEKHYLAEIVEHTDIEKRGEGAAFTEDNGKSWTDLAPDTIVSMNMWGFSNSILEELQSRFPKFLNENLMRNPLKCEYFLTFVVEQLLSEKKATVEVLDTLGQWYGVTYKKDKSVIVEAIRKMKESGKYPKKLWKDIALK